MKYKKRTSTINYELDFFIAEFFNQPLEIIDNIPLNIIEYLRQYFYEKDYESWKEWH